MVLAQSSVARCRLTARERRGEMPGGAQGALCGLLCTVGDAQALMPVACKAAWCGRACGCVRRFWSGADACRNGRHTPATGPDAIVAASLLFPDDAAIEIVRVLVFIFAPVRPARMKCLHRCAERELLSTFLVMRRARLARRLRSARTERATAVGASV